MNLTTPWAAVKFYAGYLLDGGVDVRIPCIMPTEDFLQSAPSFKPYMGDVALGEKAALALRITLAMQQATEEQAVTIAEIRLLLKGARLQVVHIRRSDHAEAIRKATGRIIPVKATRGFQEQTHKALEIAWRLQRYFEDREVI